MYALEEIEKGGFDKATEDLPLGLIIVFDGGVHLLLSWTLFKELFGAEGVDLDGVDLPIQDPCSNADGGKFRSKARRCNVRIQCGTHIMFFGLLQGQTTRT